MQLVLDTKGISIKKKNNSFLIVGENGKRIFSPAKLSSIAITANAVLHTDAIRLAIKNEIPILFFDQIGKAQARLWSPYFENIATLRRKQIIFSGTSEATAWIIDLLYLKTQGQMTNLRFLSIQRITYLPLLNSATKTIQKTHRNFQQYRTQLIEECRNNLMGTEGTIARIYWQAIGTTLPQPYTFNKRSRRPALDFYNAATNYLYGMLYTVVESALFAVGLDPYLGILHVDEHQKPTLAFDLIEAFRPWVDQLLLETCLKKQIDKKYFTKNQYGLFLNKSGKGFFIPLFHQLMQSERKFLNRTTSVKNHIYGLSRSLAQRIRTSID